MILVTAIHEVLKAMASLAMTKQPPPQVKHVVPVICQNQTPFFIWVMVEPTPKFESQEAKLGALPNPYST